MTGYITDRMRDLNFRGLSLELRLLLLLLLAPLFQPSVGKTTATSTTDDLPHPWLTENRTAKVLELLCRPPANIKWDKIYDLKLRFSPQSTEVTLASVTTATEFPSGVEVPDIARVSFNGNWDNPSLSVLMPFTSKDSGEYSCSGQYKEQGSTGGTAYPYFNTTITVNGLQSQPRKKHNFEVRLTDAHEVRVTWSPPKEPQSIQASVSSTLVDKDGKDLVAGRSLVTTNGAKTFVYTSRVLLEEFRKPNGDVDNFSMRLYVDSDMCDPYCRYSCHVPYKRCYGQDVQFCVCRGQEGQGTDCKTGFYIVLALLLLLVTSLVISIGVLYYLFKTRKYENCKCWKYLIKRLSNESVTRLAKYFKQLEEKRLSGVKSEDNPPQKNGRTSNSRGTRPEESPEDASEARNTQIVEPQSSTPPSEGIGLSHAETVSRSSGQTIVALPPPAASSGDNNPTLDVFELCAGRDGSFPSQRLENRSDDRLETNDNSPSDDPRRAEATTEVVPKPRYNQVQSESGMAYNVSEASENRQTNAAVRLGYFLRSSETGDETQTPLIGHATSQSQGDAP